MFRDCLRRKRSKKKKEAKAFSSAVKESASANPNSSIPVPSSAVGSQISANSKVRPPSPISQSNVPALTQSGGTANDVTKAGPNTDYFVSEPAVNENVSIHTNSLTTVPSSAVGSQIPANPNQRSPSPTSQSNVLALTQSGGIATHITEFGPNADFAGATAIAFGPQSTATHNSYHIRLGDKELAETQVEEFMTGLTALPNKMVKLVSSQSSINLPRAPAAHDDYRPQKEREPCFQGTREAVLKEIANWFLVIGTSQIYVLSGLAGIGKSTIAHTVAQRADRLGLLGASFFFSRKEAERSTAERFFTTIAFHLCVYDDSFARAIESLLATNQGKSATTKDPETQLAFLIIEPLRDLVRSRTQPVVIVVDALDECEHKDARVILRALGELVHEIPSFKILLTTRPQPHLDDLLSSHEVFYLRNIEDKIINNDIRRYLKFRLSTEQVKSVFPNLRKSWSGTDDDIDTLVQAAGKLFIVASTSVLFILDEMVRNPASQMKKLRSELARNHTPLTALGDFYSIILHAVIPTGSNLVERFQKVIGAIALLYSPLSVHALEELIGIQEEDICGVLDNLRSVILLGPDDIPYIYHKSFSDWIMDAEYCKAKDYRIDPRNGHTWLTTRCLQAMNERLRRNILKIDGAAHFMTNSQALKQKRIKEEILEKISSVLQYACLSWARHFKEANVIDADLVDKLKIFVAEHVPHWIECMSWTISIRSESSRLDLDGYDELLEQPPFLDVHEPLSDSIRLLSKFWPLIQTSALSIYHSALPFAPTESLLYRTYKRELMDNICRVQGGPKRWDAVITSPTHGQHLDYLMFIDDHEFASCSAESINIWHSKTGTHQRTMANSSDVTFRNMIYLKNMSWSAGSPILSTALSPNNHQLAVALSNGSVDLWAVGESTDPTQIAKFDGFGSDGDSRHHLAFSPNGDWIAYRLASGGFALRNAINGEHITDGNYNSAMVHRLLFSPDGSQLASLFVEDDHEYTLVLCDCTDGKLLGGARDIGSEVAFSADGSLIATGGLNNALTLWNRKDGDQGLHFIETPDLSSLERISCLAFSQDGMLAIGSADTGIILYNVAKRSFITTIPFPKPSAIALSSDCTRLAIGNNDGDLRLLDVPTIKESAQTLQENVSALVFSPDCSRLASGSEDGTIRVWDTSCTSELIATHEGHSSKITTIAFTPEGGQFASGDVNGTIKLWSSDDCAPSDTIQWPISGALTSVAVGNYLLAAATKDSIALWNLQRSSIIDRLGECGSSLLSFSNQDENLLLASFDGNSNKVTVWDVGNRTPSATFSIGPLIERMVFYPDNSHILVHDDGSEGLLIFDVVNKVLSNGVLISSDAIDQGVVPSWKEIPVWMRCSNNHYSIRGRFSEGDGNYTFETVCQLPGDLDVVKAAYGSSMFALLCKNGCLVLLQSN